MTNTRPVHSTGASMKFIIGLLASLAFGLANAEPINFLRIVNTRLNESVADVKAAGFNAIRLDLPWHLVQPTGGSYDFTPWTTYVKEARAQNLEVILILAYKNGNVTNGGKPSTPAERLAYGNYVDAAVRAFKDKAKYFELYNEFNSTTGTPGDPGSADEYIELAAYIRPIFNAAVGTNTIAPANGSGAAEPNKLIIGAVSPGGVVAGGFLQQILSGIPGVNGGVGIQQYADFVSFHPYAMFVSPNDKYKNRQHAENVLDIVKSYLPQISKDIIITETGWPTSRTVNGFGVDIGVSEGEQSDEVARYFLTMASATRVRGAVLFNLYDDGTNVLDRERRFGVYRYSPLEVHVPRSSPR